MSGTENFRYGFVFLPITGHWVHRELSHMPQPSLPLFLLLSNLYVHLVRGALWSHPGYLWTYHLPASLSPGARITGCTIAPDCSPRLTQNCLRMSIEQNESDRKDVYFRCCLRSCGNTGGARCGEELAEILQPSVSTYLLVSSKTLSLLKVQFQELCLLQGI